MNIVKTARFPFRTDLLVLQPTPFCNLACTYCYLNQKDLVRKMSFDVLRRVVHEILISGPIERHATLVWHAGEPLTLPISYYEKAFSLIEEMDTNKLLTHSIQTNGTTINDNWCQLFRQYNVDVGVSIDGPQNIHDLNRIDRRDTVLFLKLFVDFNC
jgi:uncharacterized protein